MDERTTLDQWDPFNFKIEGVFGFKRHFENLIKEKRYKTALDRINMIRDKYSDALEFGKINSNTFRFHHFKSYWEEQSEMRSKGLIYPDGSRDKVIFELNHLEKRIKEADLLPDKPSSKAQESEKKESKHGLNKVSRGIVLHYLMEYGNEKFRPTTDKVTLSEYLVQIGEPEGTSGIQGYNKGALALANERTGREAKPGIISRQDFLNALKCLESEDEKAFNAASEEFNSLCRDDLESDGGNEPKFFKK